MVCDGFADLRFHFLHVRANGDADADVKQLKAILAAAIIKPLDTRSLSVRKAQAATGIAAADFSRMRNADRGRLPVDRLMTIINRIGGRVDVTISVRKTGHKATETRLAP